MQNGYSDVEALLAANPNAVYVAPNGDEYRVGSGGLSATGFDYATRNFPGGELYLDGQIPSAGYSRGGVIKMAKGGYLADNTDGMADQIPAQIDGQQPAALSGGEFVWPADVVSHFGNGNSEAGADVLYDIMANIREDRTGNPEQGEQVDPYQYFS